MENEPKEVREDIGLLKHDLLEYGAKETWKRVEKQIIADSRLYWRSLLIKAMKEMLTDKESSICYRKSIINEWGINDLIEATESEIKKLNEIEEDLEEIND